MSTLQVAAQRLAGTALALTGSKLVLAEWTATGSAGGAVIVPGGTAHTFWNPRPDPARYVLVMGARTFALTQAIRATDDRSPDRMRQLYAAHGATLPG